MYRARRFAVLGGLLLTTVALAATLKSVLSFDLPGPPGKRFDYLTIDYDDHTDSGLWGCRTPAQGGA